MLKELLETNNIRNTFIKLSEASRITFLRKEDYSLSDIFGKATHIEYSSEPNKVKIENISSNGFSLVGGYEVNLSEVTKFYPMRLFKKFNDFLESDFIPEVFKVWMIWFANKDIFDESGGEFVFAYDGSLVVRKLGILSNEDPWDIVKRIKKRDRLIMAIEGA